MDVAVGVIRNVSAINADLVHCIMQPLEELNDLEQFTGFMVPIPESGENHLHADLIKNIL